MIAIKVLLINVLNKYKISTDNLKECEESIGSIPPLSLMYIYSSIKAFTDCDVELIDADALKLENGNLLKVICKKKPDLVAQTVTTFTLLENIGLAEQVKSVLPHVTIVFGGIHPSIFPYETINLKPVDYVITGEGEGLFVRLIKIIDSKTAIPKKIPGLLFKKKSKIFGINKKVIIENLDSLPFPYRDKKNNHLYNSIIGSSNATSMVCSRGCIYDCTFCSRVKYRPRSYMNCVEEIKEINDMGIKEINMYDDVFTIDKKRIINLCKEIIKQSIDIIWDIRTRVDLVDKELLYYLRKAGCIRIKYGIESASELVLKSINKNISIQQINKAISITKESDIEPFGFFMIGNPGENLKSIKKTINFALRSNLDYAYFTITTPFPSTKIYDTYLNKGNIDYWKEFAKNPNEHFTPKTHNEFITKDKLHKFALSATKRFYFKPMRLMKHSIAHHYSIDILKHKALFGFKLIKTS